MKQSATPALAVGRRLALLLLILGFVGGCPLHVVQEPPLEMPPRPPIRFVLCGDMICLSQDDGDQLLKYLHKLDAFAAARARLMR